MTENPNQEVPGSAVRIDRARAEGAFLAAAVGDALGWPHEMHIRRTDRTDRPGSMRFQTWKKRAGGRFLPHEETIAAGEYSDDTQLILAAARCLLNSGSSWWLRFATEELPFWTLYQRGGGSATRRAASSWAAGLAPWDARPAEADRYFFAGGNGVAMRVLPHCLRRASRGHFSELSADIMTDGVTTHGHPRALVGALAYGYGLWKAFRQRGTLDYGQLLELVRQGREEWGPMPSIGERWPGWANAASRRVDYDALWSETIREQMELLERSSRALEGGAAVVDEEVLAQLGCFDRATNGSGTVNAAALFLGSRHAVDPLEGLQQAVEAEGADTDTLASMAGGLLGALLGTDWMSSFVRDLQDSETVRSVARALLGEPYDGTLERSPIPMTKASLQAFVAEMESPRATSTLTLPNGLRARAENRSDVVSGIGSVSARVWRLTLDDGQTIFLKKLTRATRKASEEATAAAKAQPRDPKEVHSAPHLGSFVPTVSAARFATAFELRPKLVAWFLGAGASAASGIPTGYAMIRDFKTQIFCRETNISRREIDTADSVWIERIDAFFRQTSLLPPAGDPEEYAAAFEAVYPHPRHRRQYIDDAVSRGTPCFGHNVLGSLMAAGKVDCVFTTNFDPLVEEAALGANAILPVFDQHRPTVAAIDSADRAMRCLNESDWPLIAKLHGDYQSTSIKNTGSELKAQDIRMRHVLVEACKRFGMVVVGYSGRDTSIMEALTAVLESPSPFPNGLYWLTSSPSRLLPAVTRFLDRARLARVDVAIIECATFDELAADVLKVTDLPRPLLDRVMEGRPRPRVVPVRVPTVEVRAYPVLRYSALLVERMPCTARRMKLSKHATSPVIRELLKGRGVKATVAVRGRELAVFGKDREVLDALAPLGAMLDGEMGLDVVADSWAMGLVYDAMVRSLTRRLPLIPRYKRSGHSIVVASPSGGDGPERARQNALVLSGLRNAYESDLTGIVPGQGLPFQEGAFLKLDLVDGRWWCGFEPYTFVHVPRQGLPLDGTTEHAATPIVDPMGARRDPVGDWRRERWAQRYNKSWAGIIDAWARLLTGGSDRAKQAFGLGEGVGIDASFEMSPITGWSRPGHHHPHFDRTTR